MKTPNSVFTLAAAIIAVGLCRSTALWAGVLAFENFGSHANDATINESGDGAGWTGAWSGSGAYFNAPGGATNFLLATNVYQPSTATYAFATGRVIRHLNISGSGPFGVNGYIDGSSNIGANGKTLYIAWSQKALFDQHYYGFEFFRDGTVESNRFLQVSTDGLNTNNLNLRANGSTASPVNGNNPVLNPDNKSIHYLVLRLDFGASNVDTARVYLNPPLFTTEPGTPTSTLTANDLSFDRLSFAKFIDGALDIDNIRVATTYADVVGIPVPEPSTFVLGGLALLAGLCWARVRGQRASS